MYPGEVTWTAYPDGLLDVMVFEGTYLGSFLLRDRDIWIVSHRWEETPSGSLPQRIDRSITKSTNN